MKKVLWIVVCAMIAIAAQAKEITEQQALQKAQAFWQGKVFTQSTEAKSMRRAPQALAQSDAYYVFNVEKNGGFVIIAGDDAVDPVIGYATEGNFDSNDMPENMRSWLEGMAKEIKAIASASVSTMTTDQLSSRRTVQTHRAITPLVITKWDQGTSDGVYNAKLPLVDGELPVTGCVATAGAQLMYYYHKDLPKVTTVVPGYQVLDYYGNDASNGADTSADLPAIEFKWDKMKTQYSSSDAGTEEAEAVADLMLYCGYAAQMNYGLSNKHGGSGASSYNLANGMCLYFGFNASTWQGANRSDYSISEWDELIYNELASGRPLLYSGSSDRGGHSFICDGYDGNGLYHFNWGWGGSYNGFYKLTASTPYGDDGRVGYIMNNSCIIGLQPTSWPDITDSNADDTWEVPTVIGNTLTIYDTEVNGTTLKIRFWNDSDETRSYGLALGEMAGNGSITVIDSRESEEDNPIQGWYTKTRYFYVTNYSLPEGTHKLVLLSKLKGETEWKLCKPTDTYFQVVVSGGTYNITTHPIQDLQVTDFAMATGGNTSYAQTVKFSVTNNGDNFERYIYLYVGTADENGKCVSSKNIKIATGNTKNYRMSIGKLEAGTHTLRLIDENNNVLAQKEVTIKEDLAVTSYDIDEARFTGSTIKVNATVESRAGEYNGPLYFFAGQSGNKTLYYIAGAGIEGNSSEVIPFYFKPTATGQWTLYIATDGNGNNVIGTTTVDITEAPTGNVTLQMTDFSVACTGTSAILTLTLKNTGATTNYQAIRIALFEEGASSTNYIRYSPKVTIKPGETKQVTMTLDGLTDGMDYEVYFHYYTSYSGSLTWFASKYFTYQSPSIKPGDSNGDGVVDINDALAIFNYVIGKPASTFNAAAADMNGDGTVDIADAVKIVNILMGKE